MKTIFKIIGIIILFSIISNTCNYIFDNPIEIKNQEPQLKSLATHEVDEDVEVKNFTPYEILNTEQNETPKKAMIKSKAYLISDSITKEKLTGTLNKIYNDLKNYSGFKNYSSPTVISIALYTSKDRALNMPESWIAMLTKTPTNSQPEISFDDFKLEAQSIDKNERKTDSDTLYEKTVKYFSARKIDLCYIHKTLNDLELKTIRQADAKYPNFGDDHLEYQKKLYKKEKYNLFKKYRIHDTMSFYVLMFGLSRCK